jgi:hypothetical protein
VDIVQFSGNRIIGSSNGSIIITSSSVNTISGIISGGASSGTIIELN